MKDTEDQNPLDLAFKKLQKKKDKYQRFLSKRKDAMSKKNEKLQPEKRNSSKLIVDSVFGGE